MKGRPRSTLRFITSVLVILGIAGEYSAAAPAGDLEPRGSSIAFIGDNTFAPADWDVTAEIIGDADYDVSQQLTGGLSNSPFRFISHSLAPVNGSGLNVIRTNHIYLAEEYDPGLEGSIGSIDYREYGIILSFPFDEAFSTTQPLLLQSGILYRSPKFLRFIAENGSHDWELGVLSNLTEADFVRVGGSEDEHPDFSALGDPIRFGFTRTNSRSSTIPDVPPDQAMVIDQGVDEWIVFIQNTPGSGENTPPTAVADTFILNGENRSLPLTEFFDVVDNDTDPDQDSLEVIVVSQPNYGSASILSAHTVVYQLDEARSADAFSYTISDDEFTSTANVEVLLDCACTVLCLNQLTLPRTGTADTIDLPLIYRFRDLILKPTYHGKRYVSMYYTSNPEILVNIVSDEPLRAEAVDTIELWQANLSSVTDGDGSKLITQPEIDALELFLSHLSAASSPQLQQVIAAELQRIGPLDGFVGLTAGDAKRQVFGAPRHFFPIVRR